MISRPLREKLQHKYTSIHPPLPSKNSFSRRLAITTPHRDRAALPRRRRDGVPGSDPVPPCTTSQLLCRTMDMNVKPEAMVTMVILPAGPAPLPSHQCVIGHYVVPPFFVLCSATKGQGLRFTDPIRAFDDHCCPRRGMSNLGTRPQRAPRIVGFALMSLAITCWTASGPPWTLKIHRILPPVTPIGL